jgi:hypothetical protein
LKRLTADQAKRPGSTMSNAVMAAGFIVHSFAVAPGVRAG